jgi:hypothetical protein
LVLREAIAQVGRVVRGDPVPRYVATLKDGDRIRTTAENEASARARIRDLYHVRQQGFLLVRFWGVT